MKKIILPIFGFLAIACLACYPLSTGAAKWRIKKNKEAIQKKEEILAQNQAPDQKTPNIIIILADDLGKYEVSAYGAEHIHTPYIDQLAREGVLFEEAYVTAPVCSPSRAGLLTGRYQQRFGFETNIMEFYPTNMIEYLTGKYLIDIDNWVVATQPRYPREWQIAKQGLPPEEITMAEFFKSFGYDTGIIGKWHLGSHKINKPINRGFDFQYGFYGAFSLYTPEQLTPGYMFHIQEDFSSQYQWNSGRNNEGAILLNDELIEEKEYLTFAIKDRAIQYLKDHQNGEKPFFLYLPFSAPHIPFQAPVDYYCMHAHVEDENKRVYYAMISALDDAIGEIHQAVKDYGMEENTIIYFLSDNGGAAYTGATENGPLKGGKLTPFEGGVNIPFVMKWKGHIPEGMVYSPPVTALDIFTTSAAAANFPLPKDRVYDGKDLIPYVHGTIQENPYEEIYWKADHLKAMRKDNWKMIYSDRDGWQQIYDLETDKGEEENLLELKKEQLEELREQHLKWQLDLPEKPLWPRLMDRKFLIDDKEFLFPA